MCINCAAKAISNEIIGDLFGVKFEDKKIGTASPEATAAINALRSAKDKLASEIKAELEEAKKAVMEKHRATFEALEQNRKDAWKQAFEEIGLELDPDGEYSIDKTTGEISTNVMSKPGEKQGATL